LVLCLTIKFWYLPTNKKYEIWFKLRGMREHEHWLTHFYSKAKHIVDIKLKFCFLNQVPTSKDLNLWKTDV
jgi:hypothetical protein